MKTSRRTFLRNATISAVAGLPELLQAQNRLNNDPLNDALGLVTASLSSHISSKSGVKGKFTLLELPKIMRDELDLKVIDFNTMNFHTYEPAYLEKLRSAADDAGCLMTNLKMNQKVDMSSSNAETKAKAMKAYKQSIDAAALLGLKWVRPLPRTPMPDMKLHVQAYHELIDYAGERNIVVLVENFGWMMKDPDSMVKLVREIDSKGTAAGVDTGNWVDNNVRYSGLEKSFPLAVTCDFKAKTMGPDGGHTAYDLKRCFDIAWQSGFRGPWCFEHGHKDRNRAFRELGMLRDWLRKWTA
ncbi:MAG: hypothetical protein GXP30_00890 [Verrucomicrobia bacterium]|nr:hypothetical protein [Verrucomicrobiota bacterium]